jgi:catechol 2,3-dioxygenase-like lactoylglutathione lyase family enzyme
MFQQVNLIVTDMEASAGFYRRLGLELGGEDGPWAAHHRSADGAGGADLELDSPASARTWNRGWPGGPGVTIGFRLTDREAVDRTYADLVAAGHPGQQEPYDAFWGARFAVVLDPDGTAVGLMSPVDPSRATPPPPPD